MVATQVEQGVPISRGRWSDPPAASSPDVEGRLVARRGQIRSLRRFLARCDTAVTLLLATLALLAGHPLAAATVTAVLLVSTAHVWAADRPRAIVSVRPLCRSALVLSGAACVLVALLDLPVEGRDALLGAAASVLALSVVRVVVRMPSFARGYGFGQRRRLVVGDPAALEGTEAHRSPAVASGEVILVVTRAEAAAPVVPGGLSVEQRQQRDERRGPSGVVERVVRTALDNGAERVTVIPGAGWEKRQLRELSWLLEGTGIDMVIATDLDGIAPHRVDVVQQDGRLMIKVGSASPQGTHALVKGATDRVGAAVLLVLASPVLLGIALAIRLESRGPAIFRQTRVREGGDTFTMYKFRSMGVDAESRLGALLDLNVHDSNRPLFKIVDDPRITRVGHLLRKTSLDELPQLVNVLKGEMSLIGPRPALPREVQMYDYVARRRLAVKPGMTGLWQVSGRSTLSWDESIGFDLDYVDNWSPFADAAIALRTFRAVITKDGAF